MPVERRNDLRAFQGFIEERLFEARDELSLDEALGLWEAETADDHERAETSDAVREALDDMRAGDEGVPVGEFMRELRRKLNLPNRT